MGHAHESDRDGDDDASRGVRVITLVGERRDARDDVVAHEEPLEIQVNGAGLAVTMRTPGDDHDLALGFLLAERVVSSVDDVASMRHCPSVKDEEAEENILRVVLREGVEVPFSRLKRNFFASSSCGVCGRATIDSVLAVQDPIVNDVHVDAALLYRLPPRLRAAQATFETTGGLHAAGFFDREGSLVVLREDVGRHNAVDKAVGALARAGRDPRDGIILVSGRVGFEIVQKAAAARIPVIAGVSAPSSLAVRLADDVGMTLVGFLRGETMNVYTHPERIR